MEKMCSNRKRSAKNDNTSVDSKDEIVEELEDKELKKVDDKKKARLRTRGPYRKANLETQRK